MTRLWKKGRPGWWFIAPLHHPLNRWLRHGGWVYLGPKRGAWWWRHGVRLPIIRRVRMLARRLDQLAQHLGN